MNPPRMLLVVLLAVVALSACGRAAGNPQLAASVNGERITVEELEARFELVAAGPQFQQAAAAEDPLEVERVTLAQILSQAVRDALLTQGAAELDIEVTAEDVSTRLDDLIVEQFGSREAFEERLAASGATQEEIDAEVRRIVLQERISEALTSGIEIDEEEVRAFYDQQFGVPTIRHIVTATEEEAQDALLRVAGGEEFAAVAAEVSLDTQSGPQGGELGPFDDPSRFPPAFAEAVLAAPDGQLIGPVETELGWHVIERGAPPELDEVADRIEDELRTQRTNQLLGEWIGERTAGADVVVNPRFGRWSADTGEVLAADPLGDLQPVDAGQGGAPGQLGQPGQPPGQPGQPGQPPGQPGQPGQPPGQPGQPGQRPPGGGQPGVGATPGS